MTSTPVGDIYQKLKKRTKKKLTRKHENRSVSSDDSFQTVIEKRATKKVFGKKNNLIYHIQTKIRKNFRSQL